MHQSVVPSTYSELEPKTNAVDEKYYTSSKIITITFNKTSFLAIDIDIRVAHTVSLV